MFINMQFTTVFEPDILKAYCKSYIILPFNLYSYIKFHFLFIIFLADFFHLGIFFSLNTNKILYK